MHKKLLTFIFTLILGFSCAFADYPVEVKDEVSPEILETSVLVYDKANSNSGWKGSGTVVYQKDKIAYVLSCAHLFNGNAKRDCGIKVCIKDGKRLEKPIMYKATIVGIDHNRDLCLIKVFNVSHRFKYLPIAPETFAYTPDKECFSTGRPQTKKTTYLFKTKINKISNVPLNADNSANGVWCEKCGKYHASALKMVTTNNGSIGGQSGGGLFADKALIGVCSRCSDSTNGSGFTNYITLRDIHDYIKELKCEFILDKPSELWNDTVIHTDEGEVPAQDIIY